MQPINLLLLLLSAVTTTALTLDQMYAAGRILVSESEASPAKASSYDKTSPIGKASTITSKANLINYKGPILKNVEVRPLYFGNVAFKDDLDAFYIHITKSSWMDIMAQYGVGRGILSIPGRYIRATTNRITDSQIKNLLLAMVKSGDLKPNENTYYPIHFSAGIIIVDDNDDTVSCSDWCGYHGTLELKGLAKVPLLYYGVIPDFGDGSGCQRGCGGVGKTELENIFSTSSHELAEAVTDPGVGIKKLAWYDYSKATNKGDDRGEIADICTEEGVTVGDDGRRYVIQEIWSNLDGKCMANANNMTAIGGVAAVDSTVHHPAVNYVNVASSGSSLGYAAAAAAAFFVYML
ncbi:hypothetical protein BDR26DRAFT_1006411 [Obelidium mucronatum]|nr:hypothetical protein BDR26DRAFT_1006411 [Obelidium mucronatum]